jgi:hypothetical protein
MAVNTAILAEFAGTVNLDCDWLSLSNTWRTIVSISNSFDTINYPQILYAADL